MAMTKAERRRNSARRVRDAAQARRRRLQSFALTPLGAGLGQTKALANRKLGKTNLPIQYAVGGALAGLSMLQTRESMITDAGLDLGIGMISGQWAVAVNKRNTGA